MVRLMECSVGLLFCLMLCLVAAQEKPKMVEEIVMNPIGFVHSPYKEPKGTPIQGVFDDNKTEAWVELKDKYAKGLTDLDGFSHAILLYHFHLSDRVEIVSKPYLEGQEHGIFARLSDRAEIT